MPLALLWFVTLANLLRWPLCLAQRLRDESISGCMFEVVMVDNRPWKRLGAQNMPYWVMTGLINYAYASRFAYTFRLVRPSMQSAADYPGWNKVLYLRDRLSELGAGSACTWLLYLDADAFVREPDLPLPVLLGSLARRYAIPARAGALLAREENLTGSLAEPPAAAFLNTGVMLLRSGASGRELLDAWLLAGRHVEHRRLWNTWPGEQGILSELLLPGSYPPAKSSSASGRALRRSFAVVNMTEMNSPWGRFVQHNWGKTATDCLLRDLALRDALLRLDCLKPACLAGLRRGVQAHTVSWTPRQDVLTAVAE